MVNMNYMYFKRKLSCAIMGTVRKKSSNVLLIADDKEKTV